MRYTCGRLESRYRYSKDIVYHNFPWPEAPGKKHAKAIDRAVDAAYGRRAFTSDAERVAFLFELYQRYTSLLPANEKKKRVRKERK